MERHQLVCKHILCKHFEDLETKGKNHQKHWPHFCASAWVHCVQNCILYQYLSIKVSLLITQRQDWGPPYLVCSQRSSKITFWRQFVSNYILVHTLQPETNACVILYQFTSKMLQCMQHKSTALAVWKTIVNNIVCTLFNALLPEKSVWVHVFFSIFY